MVKHIRPHRVFSLVETASHLDRMIQVVLPDKHTTPVLLETAILIALTKVVKPRAFLEFGTFVGVQLMNLAANLPASTKIYTVDLDQETFKDLPVNEHDLPLARTHFEYEDRLAFQGTPFEERITCLRGDSKRLDFSSLAGSIDMVYVDGGHDLETLDADSQNAFRMLRPETFSCVAWHDYGSANYPHLTRYLDDLSEERDLYHVEDTMICFHFANPPPALSDRLS